MTERDIFIAALQKEDLAERQAYLDEACAGQSELRRQVEHLLRLDKNAGSFMEAPAAESAATRAVPDAAEEASSGEAPGALIGPYKLLEQIGEGGMGTVWMAQQTEPVKRVVAVKLIKAGMDSRQVIARFEAERQALALMDHAEHRPRAGGRHHAQPAGRTSSWTSSRGCRSPSIATSTISRPGNGWNCSYRSARRSSTPTRRASSIATSSRPTCSSPFMTASRCRRSSTSAWPRRPGNS